MFHTNELFCVYIVAFSLCCFVKKQNIIMIVECDRDYKKQYANREYKIGEGST